MQYITNHLFVAKNYESFITWRLVTPVPVITIIHGISTIIKPKLSKWTTRANLFVVVRACLETVILSGWADNRRMVHQCAADSLNNKVLNSVFSSSLVVPTKARVQSALLFYLQLGMKREIDICLFQKAFAQSEMQTTLSRNWTWFTKSINLWYPWPHLLNTLYLLQKIQYVFVWYWFKLVLNM